MITLRSPFSAGFTRTAADDLAATLKVLASPPRLAILAMLHEAGPMTAAQLQTGLGNLSQPTVAHHLRTLIDGGFIDNRRGRDGIARVLVPGRMATIAGLLYTDGAA